MGPNSLDVLPYSMSGAGQMPSFNAATIVKTDDQLRDLEKLRLRALVSRDLVTATQLHSPDFHLITPAGSTFTRLSYLQAVQDGTLKYLRWRPGEIAVRRTGEIAILRYRATLSMALADRQDHRFQCWHTDVYEVQDKHWQVTWSQATLCHRS